MNDDRTQCNDGRNAAVKIDPHVTQKYLDGVCSTGHNSSSSSILVSIVVEMLPSELPRSFCALSRVCPRLFRTLSSKPGSEARCFLKGEAMELSVLISAGGFPAAADEDDSPADDAPGAGVPESGEADSAVGDGVGRPRGSAECWRFSYAAVSTASKT